jgi:hypothetical protein
MTNSFFTTFETARGTGAFTNVRDVRYPEGVKRAIFVVSLAAGALALASAACGTLLDISPDAVGSGDAGAAEAGANGDGGDAATANGLGAQLTPAVIDLLAGDTNGATLIVSITRPSLVATPVTVTVGGGPDIVASAMPLGNTTTQGALVFRITAPESAAPRRMTVDVTLTDGAATTVRPLTVLLARHYRKAAPPAELVLTSAQTYLVKAWGAGGGFPFGGAGGFAQGVLGLGPGTYYVVVGSSGSGSGQGGAGGIPGGGASSPGVNGTGGGGYSGLFAKGTDSTLQFDLAQVVAGAGGGGSTASGSGFAGGAGGSTGASRAKDGEGSPSSGALPTAGGTGAPGSGGVTTENGLTGAKLAGGSGGTDGSKGGGGGGGGYWGGGGGGGGTVGTGGGGGSSFVIGMPPSAMTVGGTDTTPGNDGDVLRGTAGNVASDGAVLVIPQ